MTSDPHAGDDRQALIAKEQLDPALLTLSAEPISVTLHRHAPEPINGGVLSPTARR